MLYIIPYFCHRFCYHVLSLCVGSYFGRINSDLSRYNAISECNVVKDINRCAAIFTESNYKFKFKSIFMVGIAMSF